MMIDDCAHLHLIDMIMTDDVRPQLKALLKVLNCMIFMEKKADKQCNVACYTDTDTDSNSDSD